MESVSEFSTTFPSSLLKCQVNEHEGSQLAEHTLSGRSSPSLNSTVEEPGVMLSPYGASERSLFIGNY
jgi:hypothetical protein